MINWKPIDTVPFRTEVLLGNDKEVGIGQCDEWTTYEMKELGDDIYKKIPQVTRKTWSINMRYLPTYWADKPNMPPKVKK